MIDIIIFICMAYFGFGAWLSYALFARGYGGKHQDEKMLATIFFWPILIVGAVVVLCVLVIYSAFKGLYYIVKEVVKNE